MPEINVKPKGLEATSMGKYYFPEKISFVEIKTDKRVKEQHQERTVRQEWAFGE